MAARAERLPGVGMALIACGLIAVGLAGCRSTGEFGPQARCAIAPQAGVPEIIAHVNQNTARIQSWRALNAAITSPDLPVSISASVAVEPPRNFRLVARSPFGPEVDLGSNPEHYWFWARQDESKRIYLARHERTTDEGSVRLARPDTEGPVAGMPFEPEWIMEAMGVIAMDPGRVREIRRDPQARIVTLEEQRISPGGEPVFKLTAIDLCHGLVREHALYDAKQQLIARATLREHVRDTSGSQAVLPAKIDLVWPMARINMTMRMGAIEINQGNIPKSTFAVQQYSGSEVFNVGGTPAGADRPVVESTPGFE